MTWEVVCADVLDWAAEYDGPKFHAVLCDPPYGLEFMGKEWDRFSGYVADTEFKGFHLPRQRKRNIKCPECNKYVYDHEGRRCTCGGVKRAQLQAFEEFCYAWAKAIIPHLHPGGFVMAFGGSRTFHRLACAIEDAGLIVHPAIGWVNGQGFPKATRIDTQVDKAAGRFQDRRTIGPRITGDGHIQNRRAGKNDFGTFAIAQDGIDMEVEPATPLAAAWQGHRYGLQAMKPALEFVCVAQKPYEGKPVESITRTGAGSLNIDQARINGAWSRDSDTRCDIRGGAFVGGKSGGLECEPQKCHPSGRWPANFCVCHSAGCQSIGTLQPKNGADVLHHLLNVTIVSDAVNHDPALFQEFVNSNISGLVTRPIVTLRPVNLNNDVLVGEEEVYHKRPLRTLDNVLVDEVDRTLLKFLLDEQLRGGNAYNAAPHSSSTLKGHTWQHQAALEEASTRHGATDSTETRLANAVGLHLELLVADRTGKLNPIALISPPEFIGAFARAGSMPVHSEFGVSNAVSCATDRAIPIVPWHIVTSEAHYTTLRQSCQIVAAWTCVEGCPVRLLGEQGGVSSSGLRRTPDNAHGGAVYGWSQYDGDGHQSQRGHNDSGTCARFFFNADWQHEVAEQIAAADPFKYQAKAGRKERDAGLDGMEQQDTVVYHPYKTRQCRQCGNKTNPPHRIGGDSRPWPACGHNDWEWVPGGQGKHKGQPRNIHPTCKPVKLCTWLATLLLPPPEYGPRRIAIPFGGSGSEGVGAGLAGWEEIVLIEQERDYCAIAEARLAHWLTEPQQMGLDL